MSRPSIAELTDPSPQATASSIPSTRFHLQGIRQILETPIPEDVWVCEGAIKEGAITFFLGPEKVGKTSLLAHLAVCVATGSNFLRLFPVKTKRKVFMFLGETTVREVKTAMSRIIRFTDNPTEEVDGIYIQSCEHEMPTCNAKDLEELKGIAAQHPGSLFIIDPLYLAADGADKSDLYEMGPKLRGLANSIAGGTLCIAHHTKKPTEGGRLGRFISMDEAMGAGPYAVAGGWVAINRHEEYVPGSLKHTLNASIGGRGGHGAKLLIQWDEGTGEFDATEYDETQEYKAKSHKAASKKREEERVKLEVDKKELKEAIDFVSKLGLTAPNPLTQNTLEAVAATKGIRRGILRAAWSTCLTDGVFLTVRKTGRTKGIHVHRDKLPEYTSHGYEIVPSSPGAPCNKS